MSTWSNSYLLRCIWGKIIFRYTYKILLPMYSMDIAHYINVLIMLLLTDRSTSIIVINCYWGTYFTYELEIIPAQISGWIDYSWREGHAFCYICKFKLHANFVLAWIPLVTASMHISSVNTPTYVLFPSQQDISICGKSMLKRK